MLLSLLPDRYLGKALLFLATSGAASAMYVLMQMICHIDLGISLGALTLHSPQLMGLLAVCYLLFVMPLSRSGGELVELTALALLYPIGAMAKLHSEHGWNAVPDSAVLFILAALLFTARRFLRRC